VVKLNARDFSVDFPRSSLYLGKKSFSAVCVLSYFVGMICPGLHSIFSSLNFTLNRAAEDRDTLSFAVRKYDARVGLFDVSFHGCIQGGLKAFLRPPPQPQPSVKELSAYVRADEFKGTRALIVGGSRGLGEITAKILTAGGGDVIITYHSGIDDARKVSDEIADAGGGHCEILKFDLANDSLQSVNIDRDSIDAVYFFATPKIFRKKAELFESHLFQEFYEIYIRKFYDLCAYLETGTLEKKIKVYFPSSVAVAERPRGMTEYSMAKSAAEVLVEDINKYFEKLSVLSTRLPRLNTDQTSSILKISSQSNVETLLPIIRSLSGPGS
jgi:NADP-dependent 3-hydroxy acid dehydrogenase YdfG